MTTTLRLDVDLAAQGRPKYEALREHFVQEIKAGHLNPGESLPTEQALAEALGVARSTVRQTMSALERDGLITRVQGKGTFVHDSAKQRLRKGVELFAIVVPETRTGFYPSLLHGFEAASGKSQHQAIVCNTENCADKQASAIIQLIDKKVAGVAIVPTSEPPTPASQIRLLQEHQIPVVFCHRTVKGVQAPLLSLPFEKIGRLAGETLIKQGHRRVAVFTMHQKSIDDLTIKGMQSALKEAGIDFGKEDIFISESDASWENPDSSLFLERSKLCDRVEDLFSQPNPPTALFTTFDPVAEMLLLRVEKMGLSIPGDVSLISFGGAWRETPMMRRLTSIVVDEAATARKAVELLTEMQEGLRPLTDNQQFELPLSISEGETVGPPPE